MNAPEIAKHLLPGERCIDSYKLKMTGEVKTIDINAEHFYDNFQVVERIKFSVPVDISDNQVQIMDCTMNNRTYIYTNWNLENEDLERKFKKFIICDSRKIYINEIFPAILIDRRWHDVLVKSENPFEMYSSNFSEHKLKVTANLIFYVEKNIAEIIIPQLKDIFYITPDSTEVIDG